MTRMTMTGAAISLLVLACTAARSGPAAGGTGSGVGEPNAAQHLTAAWLADNTETTATELVTRSRPLMGTEFRVLVVPGERHDAATAAADEVLDEATRVELMMSEWKADSALSRVNARAGVEPVAVPQELFEIVQRALDVARASDGAFDPTWAALWELWRFDRAPRVPSLEEVAARLPFVGYHDLVVDPASRSVFLRRRGMLVGLGGIAKGYALDRGAAILRARGFPDFIIYGGGQVYAGGTRGSRPWRVGIQDPRDPERWFSVLELRDASLSTSGDYERFVVVDGVRYHHIIDTRTGFPARGVRSVSVLAPDGVTADALSTAAFVLGPKLGIRLLRKFPGAEGIVVDDDNRVHVSEGLRGKILVGPPTP